MTDKSGSGQPATLKRWRYTSKSNAPPSERKIEGVTACVTDRIWDASDLPSPCDSYEQEAERME
jgi:hypothetical protein